MMKILVNTVPFQTPVKVAISITGVDAAIAFYDATTVYMDDVCRDGVSHFKVYENETQLGGITLRDQDAIQFKGALEDHGVLRLGADFPVALRSAC